MKNYSVIVSAPDAEPTIFELRGDRVGLGRELDNQIRIKINEVSSSHCEFRKLDAGGYELVDLDSTNGTRVNGKQVEKYTLEDGDRLLIGEVVSVHFVELTEGEKPSDVAVEAGEGGKQAAAAYTQMDEKLKSIEDDIAVKVSELEAMQKEHDAKKAEYEKMAASLTELESQIAAKKAGGENAEEIEKMEMELTAQTRRVQVMASDLDGQAQQLQALQGGAPVSKFSGATAPKQPLQPQPMAPPEPVVPVPMQPTPAAAPAAAAAAPQPKPVAPTPMQPPVAQPAQPAAATPPSPATPPAQVPGAIPVATPLVTPEVPAGPKTTLLTPGRPPAGAATKRLVVEEAAKPKAKFKFDK